MSDTIPSKIVRRVIADILIERSNAIDDACNEMIKKDMEKMSKILGYDCDGEEIEEFRILRFPFSAEIENWQEEPNVEPRFYCAIIGNDNKNYLISVYDDYNTEAIRKYEKMKEGEKIPTKIKNIEAASKYEVAFNGITGNAWYYDRDKNVLKERLAEIIEQENKKRYSEIDSER